MLTEFHKVAATNELGHGYMKQVTINRDEILLVRIGDEYYALDNICSHAGAYLDMGTLQPDEFMIGCPLHGGAFDVRTGEGVVEPCAIPITKYTVRVEGEDVLVGPPGA